MAVVDAYASVAEYRGAIDKSDTTDDTEILTDLTAISRWIDQRFGRFWTQDTGDVSRTYRTHAFTDDLLDIDDLVSVTSIKIDENNNGLFTDETALVAGDYELLPLNAGAGSEPRPYRHIHLTPNGTKVQFPASTLVQVTGRWGWPAIPGAIKRATIHLTAILRLETPRAEARVSELGQLIQLSPQARYIVEDLARAYSDRYVVA